MSRVISALNGVTLIITLLITNLQSPLPLQVGLQLHGLRGLGFGAADCCLNLLDCIVLYRCHGFRVCEYPKP